LKEESIWCYTGDPNKPTVELCDPIGYVDEEDYDSDLCGVGTKETLKGNG
jgi:hypothetical protein